MVLLMDQRMVLIPLPSILTAKKSLEATSQDVECWCEMQMGCLIFAKYLGIYVLMNPWGLTTLVALKDLGDSPIW
jgi:hypothetical protein